jgi:hypothetical protein
MSEVGKAGALTFLVFREARGQSITLDAASLWPANWAPS